MHPEGRLPTSSTRSPTNRLLTPVHFVKGVGPGLGALFSGRHLVTVRDLLYFFPRDYEDRTQISNLSSLSTQEPKEAGARVTLDLQAGRLRRIPLRNGRKITELSARTVGIESGFVVLKWFYFPRGLENQLKEGTLFRATGVAKKNLHGFEMIHPELHLGESAKELHTGRLVPIYVELEGISTRVLRRILWNALEAFGNIFSEDLPQRYLSKHQLPTLSHAVREIHFPESEENTSTKDTHLKSEFEPDLKSKLDLFFSFRSPSHLRIIYEEFFKFELLVLRRRLALEKTKARPFGVDGGVAARKDLEKSLPFSLTEGQSKALLEIENELIRSSPMNRMVQADVGAGKTVIAFLAAGNVISEGGQVALMAPTEILAEQHMRSLQKLFGKKIQSAFLSGSTKTKERRVIHERLASGEPLILIGTHALVEDEVVFKNLGLVIIDEQHRFGVEQRRRLRSKSPSGFQPHVLILTATPIPRTLALTAYGDLTTSIIRERPPGRKPIETFLVQEKWRSRAFERIREELQKGRQAYFIFPLIHESEAEGFTEMKSAVAECARLQKEIFSEFRVGLLHGQMTSEEKDRVMAEFTEGVIQVLVSTTVVEVGVDVPNATVMAIEHAERFGLSQLHQLRGRVGRGEHQSMCFLLSSATSKAAFSSEAGMTLERLKVLEKTEDGFEIAEEDLRIRGPGEFLGVRQSGGLAFKMGDLVRDREWLIKAREDVLELLGNDPELKNPENVSLRKYLEADGKTEQSRLGTS